MTNLLKSSKYSVSGLDQFSFNTEDFSVLKPDNAKDDFQLSKDGDVFTLTMNGKEYVGEIVELLQNKCTVMLNDNIYEFIIDTDFSYKRKQKLLAENVIKEGSNLNSPMPGKIIDIFVSEGQEVSKGSPLLILEAMKMQNQILAHKDGIIKSINVKTDDLVFADQMLLEIE